MANKRVLLGENLLVVEPGLIETDQVKTPGIYVQRVVLGERYEKRIERRTLRAGARG